MKKYHDPDGYDPDDEREDEGEYEDEREIDRYEEDAVFGGVDTARAGWAR